jgi:hypothetical protein
VPGRGMHDQAGLFVDHDQMLVLEQHRERDVLGQRLDRRRRPLGDDDLVTCAQLVTGLRRRAVDDDVAGLDQPLELRPRYLEAVLGGQEVVEAQALGGRIRGGLVGEPVVRYQIFDLTWPLDFTRTSTMARS